MQRPWMPFYWGDYLANTGHLNRAQHGSYCMLIGHYWVTGSLPDDDAQLARIAGCSPEEWFLDKPVLQAFFHDGWRHRRVEAELRRHTEKVARLRLAGEKGRMISEMNREKQRWQNQRLK